MRIHRETCEEIALVAACAATEMTRYKIEQVHFEPHKGGSLAIATDGRVLVARAIEKVEVSSQPDDDERKFPKWREVIPTPENKRTIRVNPELLIKAIKAVHGYDISLGEDGLGDEEIKIARPILIAIPPDDLSPIGICDVDGEGIASVMPVRGSQQENEQAFASARDSVLNPNEGVHAVNPPMAKE